MKNMLRNIRRLHIVRLKHNRKNYYGHHRVYGQEGIQRMSAKELNRVVFTPTLCSCPSCGNDRRHFGTRTIQELKFIETFKEYIMEF